MRQRDNDLDHLFKSKFDDFEAEPSADSWNSIQDHLSKEENLNNLFEKKGIPKSIYYVAATTLLVFATYLIFKLYNSNDDDTSKSISVLPKDSLAIGKIVDTSHVSNLSEGEPSSKALIEKENRYVTESLEVSGKDSIQYVALTNGEVVLAPFSKINTSSNTIHFSGTGLFRFTGNGNKEYHIILPDGYEVFCKKGEFTIIEDFGGFRKIPRIYVENGLLVVKDKNAQKQVIINSGQNVLLERSIDLTLESNQSNNFKSWMDGKLVFENSDFKTVIHDIQMFYGLNLVVTNPEILNCRFTGVFEKSSFDEVFQVLSSTFGIKQEMDGKSYLISGKGCK